MKTHKKISMALLLLLPFADACTAFKRFAYEDMGRRDGWQSPEKVIESLAIEAGSRVGDVGAGGGYFTFRLADAVGAEGIVYAVDVDDGMLDSLKDRVSEAGYTNITTVRGEFADPLLPEPVDLIFVSNTYHHIQDRSAYFAGVARYLRPGGRIAILEYGPDGMFQSCDHATQDDLIRTEMEAAGYTLARDFDFLTRQSFQIFQPATK